LVAAHTSPVYVVAGGEERFSPSDAAYMLTLLEGGLTWVDTLATPADAERHARSRRIFEQARQHLRRRLQAHRHPPPATRANATMLTYGNGAHDSEP
jgi:hypothetical protein